MVRDREIEEGKDQDGRRVQVPRRIGEVSETVLKTEMRQQREETNAVRLGHAFRDPRAVAD